MQLESDGKSGQNSPEVRRSSSLSAGASDTATDAENKEPFAHTADEATCEASKAARHNLEHDNHSVKLSFRESLSDPEDSNDSKSSLESWYESHGRASKLRARRRPSLTELESSNQLDKNTSCDRPQTLVEKLARNPRTWKAAKVSVKGRIGCRHCAKKFPNLLDLAIHLDQCKVPASSELCFDIDCPWSIIGFNSSNELIRHLKTQHGACGWVPPKCPYCTQEFKRIDAVQRHIARVHEDSGRQSKTNPSP